MTPANKAIHQRKTCARAHFRIFADGRGHWCANKDDGMVAGIFFSREAAIRFAHDESLDRPVVVSGFFSHAVSP